MTHPVGLPLGKDFLEFCVQLERDNVEFPDYLNDIPKFGLSNQQILFLEKRFLSFEVELLRGRGHGNQASKRRFGMMIALFQIDAAPTIVGRWLAKRRLLEYDLTHPKPQSETALAQSRKRKTPEQIDMLNEAYDEYDYYPEKDVIDDLMVETGLKKSVIKSYFQHKRKKQRIIMEEMEESYEIYLAAHPEQISAR